jgi:acetyl-CoA synthetase
MNEKMLTPKEVTERLSLSVLTVREWIRTGKLKGEKLGRLWRIPESKDDELYKKK